MYKKFFVLCMVLSISFLLASLLKTNMLYLAFHPPIATPTPHASQTASPSAQLALEIKGEYTCLPHKDTNGPQTLECALGIKTEDQKYYALDLQATDSAQLTTGDQITVKGKLTPANQLNSSAWQKYPIEGILKVQNIEKSF